VSLPPDATVQQQPQSVVVEIAKAVPNALYLLDQQVHGFGRPVGAAAGGMEGKDLSLPGSYGAGQTRQLEDMHAVAPAVEAVQRGPGVGLVAGGVDRA
jgi:hypothetical protein